MQKDVPSGESRLASAQARDVGVGLVKAAPIPGVEKYQQHSALVWAPAVYGLHRLSECMTTSHLPRHVAIKTFLEIPPDWTALSQPLIA